MIWYLFKNTMHLLIPLCAISASLILCGEILENISPQSL